MDVPKTLDWVTERSKCSVKVIFVNLEEVLISDVKAANTLADRDTRFHCNRPTSEKIIVTRDKDFGFKSDVRSVVFEMTKSSITATAKNDKGDERQILTGTPNFSADGDCFLSIGGQDLRLWQVSRQALEDLFFDI